MAAPYGQGPPPEYPPQNIGYGQPPPPPPQGFGYAQPGQVHQGYSQPGPGYGPTQTNGQYGHQQMNSTVIVTGGGPTVIHQPRRERFADNICLNLIIVFFFPFWIFVWICMCMFESQP